MPLSPSLLAYEDCQAVMDKAIEAEIGVSIEMEKPGDAVHFRQRCYKFRTLTHDIAKRTFPEDDPRRQVSPYDSLAVTIHKARPNIVEIRKRDSIALKVVELKE